MRRLLALVLAFPALAWASHPLITEDTGVLGAGRWQLEAHGERVRGTGERELALALAYGVADAADLQLEQPWARNGRTERGDAVLSLKWRFLERDALSMVLKPELDEQGRWGASLVAGYSFSRIEFLGHAGYLRNRASPGERESLRHASIAALYGATEQLRLALDLSRDTNPDPASRTSVRDAVLGLIYAPHDDVDIGLGLKRTLSDPRSRALLAGIKYRW